MAKAKNKKEQKTQPVSLISLFDATSPVAEQYRTIRTNIQFSASEGQAIRTMVITSSGPGEGKSTTSANLAVVFAGAGQKVLLIDADMRKPTVHRSFSLDNSKGLSIYLSTQQKLEDFAHATPVENLMVIPSGPKPPNPSELLGSTRLSHFIEEAKASFDVIIFDMPPIVTVTDAQIVSSKVDGTILVAREGVTEKDAAMKAKELLEISKARVLGVVYNGSKEASEKGYYHYY